MPQITLTIPGSPIAKKRDYQHHGQWVGRNPSKVWRAWKEIHRRCSNPHRENYKWYGAKGIKVSPAWDLFSAFYAEMKDPPGPEYSIDRIDNSKGYEPGNCRWVKGKDQQNNKTNNIIIEYQGEIKTLSQWSETLKIPYGRLYRRIVNPAKPWTIKEAFTKPRKGGEKCLK